MHFTVGGMATAQFQSQFRAKDREPRLVPTRFPPGACPRGLYDKSSFASHRIRKNNGAETRLNLVSEQIPVKNEQWDRFRRVSCTAHCN